MLPHSSFLILPNVRGPIEKVTAQYAETYAKTLSTRSNIATILSQAPGIVTAPIYFTVDNLRPFDIAVSVSTNHIQRDFYTDLHLIQCSGS